MSYISFLQQNGVNFNILDYDTNQSLQVLNNSIYNAQTGLYPNFNTLYNTINDPTTGLYQNFNNVYNSINDPAIGLNYKVTLIEEFDNTVTNDLSNIGNDINNINVALNNGSNSTDAINVVICNNNILDGNITYTNSDDENIAVNEGIVGILNSRDRVKTVTQSELDGQTLSTNILYLVVSDDGKQLLRVIYNSISRSVGKPLTEFTIDYLQSDTNYSTVVTNDITDLSFISSSAVVEPATINSNSSEFAYVNTSEGVSNVYTNSNYYDVTDLSNICNEYTSIINADLSNIVNVTDFSYAFYNCHNLLNIQTPYSNAIKQRTGEPTITQNSDWSYAFYNCSNLDTVWLRGSNFNNTLALVNNIRNVYVDTSFVTDVNYMFGVSELSTTNNVRQFNMFFETYAKANQFVGLVRNTRNFFGKLYSSIDDDSLWTYDPANQHIRFNDADDKVIDIYTNNFTNIVNE